ncbi:unnamed protein product [Meganyctiphanes norvegica]|uniref:Sulfatase N-terminal domain-containing protein n=1 Tax=Meganyctiphanes norvegica TaxID=48144 RepID=A0AAV2RPD1_MEGNR
MESMKLIFWLKVLCILGPIYAEDAPNIIYILADDLGWNHVSWHNPSVISPHMQELVDNGVVLEQSYVQPTCTPSRSAFLTGTYPFKYGRQGPPLFAICPTGLSVNYTLLPEMLSELGYSTHLVGKWHLGMCDWAYTPLRRGFDTFTGFYVGYGGYFNHAYHGGAWGNRTGPGGYDFRQQERVMWEANGTYSTDLYTDEAVNIIKLNENSENPFFLYFAHQNVHDPYEVPQKYLDMYPDVEDELTRKIVSMVTAMDDSIGALVDALKDTQQYENTIIVFSADNGGVPGHPESNHPLKGYKYDLWEGGTRGAAFVHSPILKDTPRPYSGLVHITDWFNTFLSIAGSPSLQDNDGFDQWEAIRTGNLPSPRQDLIYNLDQRAIKTIGGIRAGSYKYVVGQNSDEEGPWLFDIEVDPLETTNLISTNPDVAAELEALLLSELSHMVPADEPKLDPAGNPENWGGTYSPGWCTAH